MRLHLLVMKLILSTHNVTLTKSIEDHVLAKLDKLEHLDRWTIDARVTLEHDHTRVTGKQFCCSMRLGVRGPDLFADVSESNLYIAIDLVTKKLNNRSVNGTTNTKRASIRWPLNSRTSGGRQKINRNNHDEGR